MKTLLLFFCLLVLNAGAQEKDIHRIYKALQNAPRRFNVPNLALSYEENFESIQPLTELNRQELFYDSVQKIFQQISPEKISPETRIAYNCIAFELPLEIERVRLQALWKTEGSVTSPGGLSTFPHGKEWYCYFVKKFTGLNVTPEEVVAAGSLEVEKAKAAIQTIRKRLGFRNDSLFYVFLSGSQHFLTNKDSIVLLFESIDKKVRSNLPTLFPAKDPPPIHAMEWQGATESTPPGIYLSKRFNSYGADVFQYNFYNRRFNRRCMEWLYLHEALPGHHLQSSFFNGEAPFYFGTSEGWACYVEKLGKQLGLYEDVYMELGEHEWDLVRSARLVMEVGIHFFGWSRKETMAYWMKNCAGQDQIADREISRVTSWPGQSLCYKMGALTIKKIVEQQVTGGKTASSVHGFLLLNSGLPLQALL